VDSPDLLHKSDAGGVRLNINSAPAVRNAYHDIIETVQKRHPAAPINGVSIEPFLSRPNGRELMVGVFRDPVFGPVITFGAGGFDVEIFSDRSVALPPLNKFLAKDLIDLGERLGIRVECAMTFGGSPVGRTIGPALEVKEALTVLENKGGPNSLKEKSLSLAGILLEMGGVAGRGDGYSAAEEILTSGKALEKLKQIIEIQGGDPAVKSEDIVTGENCEDILAPVGGYVVAFYNKRLVELARIAGAPADKKAGVTIHKKMGERVKKGEPLISICSSSDWELESAVKDAKRQMPIVVEGMLLERYPRITEL